MTTVALTTFGCRANQYDTGVLADRLRRAECHVVDFGSKADIYVINSCAITATAVTEARQFVRRAKAANPEALVVVTGCAAQTEPEKFGGDDVVVLGNDAKDKVVPLILSCPPRVSRGGRHPDLDPRPNSSLKAGMTDTFFGGGVRLDGHTRAFLKIQDGCSQFCSFCIVPFARGLNRSIDPDRVLSSLVELRDKGVEEVVLTGIHLGTYGRDLFPRTSLLDLLRRIEKEKPVPRVRLSSIDPEEVSPDLISLFADSAIFCPHLHLPVQSGDDSILKKMRRRYTAAHFLKLTADLVHKIPQLCIGTDVIVGFPGEGEGEFENARRLLEESPVSYVHAFPYSVRSGTKAASFDGQVDPAEKKDRVREIRALSVRKRESFGRAFIGESFPVVLQDGRKGVVGLTPNYISIEIGGVSPYPRERLPLARIDAVTSDSVLGNLVPSSS